MHVSDSDDFFRLFVALELPDPVRAALVAVQSEWRRTHADVGWVHAQTMHLSLQFLGDVAAGKVGELTSALDLAADAVAPFSFEVRGAGTFGPPKAPRVVWLGVSRCPALLELHRRLVAALEAAGFPADRREYRPHLTLGRVRSRRGCDELCRAVQREQDRPFGTVEVRHLTLFRSRLLPQGAEHTALHRAPLGGAVAGAPG